MKIFFTLLFACGCLACYSQYDEERKLLLGVKGGLNSSVIVQKINEQTTYGSRLGISVAAFADIPLNDEFRIQPEIGYMDVGAVKTFQNTKTVRKISYLTFGTVAKFGFANSGFALALGPQLGLICGAKQSSPSGTSKNKDVYIPRDLSAIGGFEYEFENSLVLAARYQYGFFDISKVSTNGSLRVRAFSLTVGFAF